jgi:hypothetical protein
LSFSRHYQIRKKAHLLLEDFTHGTQEQNVNRPYRYLPTEPDRKHASSLLVAAIVAASLVTALAGCANSTASIQNQECAQHASGSLPWGYYPGFGCGPVPRAQTVFP